MVFMALRSSLRLGLGLLMLAGSTAHAGTAAPTPRGEGPLQIVVSREKQVLTVFDGDTVVATSRISSGKRGHETPTGIFSILEKRRYHESNIYSNAPMPFMQRLTWSGIALHSSGSVPAYPASHGCVRMPDAFAKTLFRMTTRGLHVVISDREVVPKPISHAFLFQPRPPAPQLLSDATLRPAISQNAAGAVEVAMSEEPATIPLPPVEPPVAVGPHDPIRMLITRRGTREAVLDAQTALNKLGYDAGVPDGALGSRTIEAIRAFKTAEGLVSEEQSGGRMTQALMDTLYRKANLPPPANARLLVRRNFTPLFEAAVTIRDPQIALGEHFYQFQDVDPATEKGLWFGLTLDNTLPKAMKARLGITLEGDALSDGATARVLDRIQLTPDLRARIDDLLAPGSSLTISDMGLGPETGQGTDFITLTRPARG
jgi:peptidoglycan hydrolase-like protein with peptidoglycan-binding domain